MYFLLISILWLLPPDSNAVKIQVHGNVDVGNQFDKFFKEIVRYAVMPANNPNTDSNFGSDEKQHHSKKKSKKDKKKHKKVKAVMEEIKETGDKVHLYGTHDKEDRIESDHIDKTKKSNT